MRVTRQSYTIYVIIFCISCVTWCVYLCLGMVCDHLVHGQQDDWARNIARCYDPQAGSWSVNAFLRI